MAPAIKAYYEWPPFDKHTLQFMEAPVKYYEWPLKPGKSPFMTTPDPMIWT